MSPESAVHREVRSPTVAAAALEGETLGPNYGAAGVGSSYNQQMNGVIGRSAASSTVLEPQGSSRDDSIPEPSRTASGSGADAVTRRTGPDASTSSQGVGAGIAIDPQGSIGITPNQAVITTSPPPRSITMHQQSTPTQQPQQVPSLQDPVRVPQVLSPPTPLPAQYPEPHSIPQPMQVVRSWTAQMASAAASVGQRMQFQTLVGQGQMELSTGSMHDGEAVGIGYNQGFHGYSMPPHGDPPPLPQHFRVAAEHDQTRGGVFAGLARAGQALRRRMIEPVLQQVSRNPPPQPPLLQPAEIPAQVRDEHPQEGLFQPAVAEAMNEWTSRRSLISPGPPLQQGPGNARDESLSTGSLSPELVREEVKKQVQLAMADKDAELRELRQQNVKLRRALQTAPLLVSDGGVGRDQELLDRYRYGRLGLEPGLNPASRVAQGPVPQGDPRRLYESAREPDCNPLSAGSTSKCICRATWRTFWTRRTQWWKIWSGGSTFCLGFRSRAYALCERRHSVAGAIASASARHAATSTSLYRQVRC